MINAIYTMIPVVNSADTAVKLINNLISIIDFVYLTQTFEILQNLVTELSDSSIFANSGRLLRQ